MSGLLNLIPLDVGEPFGEGPWLVEPVLGVLAMLLVVFLLGGALLYVRRTGFSLTSWLGRTPSPETEAKQILAERYARGDITTDDFLERASVLNWTPGTEARPTPTIKGR
jgi:uncharacterized membrane protein